MDKYPLPLLPEQGYNYVHAQTVDTRFFSLRPPRAWVQAIVPTVVQWGSKPSKLYTSLIPRIRGCMGMRLICTLTCVNWHVHTLKYDIVTVYTQTPTVYIHVYTLNNVSIHTHSNYTCTRLTMLVYTHKLQLYVCIYTNTRVWHTHHLHIYTTSLPGLQSQLMQWKA